MNKYFFQKNYVQLLLFCFILILILRVINIEQKNLWFDEVYSWNLSQKSFQNIIDDTAGDIHPPLYYISLKVWTFFFGDSTIAMRMLSVLLSILTAIVFYSLLVKFLKKRMLIIISLLIFAVSPLNIYYSQEVRMFSMNLLLCMLSVYYFVKLLDEFNLKNSVLYVLVTLAAVYTHYFSFLILGTQIVIFLSKYFSNKDKIFLKNFISYTAIILLLYLPWVSIMLSQVIRGQPWRTPQTAADLFNNTIAFFNDSFMSYYIYYSDSIPLTLIDTISFVILVISFVTPVLLFIQYKGDRTKFYITLFFSIPFIMSVIISYRNSILLSRYLSILIPFLIFTLVVFSTFIKKNSISTVYLVTLVALSFVGTFINFSYDFKNNDYREIAAFIEKEFESGDNLIVEPHFMGWYFNHHIKHSKSNLTSPLTLGWNYEMIFDSIKVKDDLDRLWIILDYSSLDTSSYNNIIADMKSLDYGLTSEYKFSLIPARVEVYRFQK